MDGISYKPSNHKSNGINKRHRNFLIVIFLCSIFYYLGTIGKMVDESVGIIALPLLVIISYIIFERKVIFLGKNLLIASLAMMLFIISYFFVGGGLGSLVNNISAVLFVLIFYNLEYEIKEFQYFAKLIFAFQIYLGIYCFYNGLSNGFIGIYNSNTMGLQVLFNLIYIDMYLGFKKKSLAVIINIASILLIFFTKSRTPLVAGFLVLLFMIINYKKIFAPWIMKLGFWILAFMGGYFPIFYVNLFRGTENSFLQILNTYSIQYFNKNLFTGREYIWIEAIEQLTKTKKNLFFGIGSHFSSNIGSNFHSSYFTVLICGGLLAYICFMWFLYQFYKRGDFASKSVQRSRLLYLAIMSMGISESTLFSGHFSIMAYMLLCASKSFNLEE